MTATANAAPSRPGTSVVRQPGQPTDGGSTVAASVDSLIVGRKLCFPIFDERGLLLLAEGSTITPEFQRLLKVRGMQTVNVHPEDAAQITLDESYSPETDLLGFAIDLTQHLDEVIDAGRLFVVNTGPAASQSFHSRTSQPVSTERQERQQHAFAESHGKLTNIMEQVERGGKFAIEDLSQEVERLFAEMTDDVDQLLSLAVATTNDVELAEHSLRVSLLAMAIGAEMKLDKDNIRLLGMCGLAQDWGMLLVPREIRIARHQLKPFEIVEIRKHPIYSLDILTRAANVPKVLPLVAYQVHERPNGNGYPRQRSGVRIHLFAKILHVADCYLAMTSPRSYRPPLMAYAAIECLLRQARSGDVDSGAVRALLQVLTLFPIGSYVVLTDGRVAQVIRRSGNDYAHPTVAVVQDADGTRSDPLDAGSIVNLSTAGLAVAQALPTPGRGEVALHPELIVKKF